MKLSFDDDEGGSRNAGTTWHADSTQRSHICKFITILISPLRNNETIKRHVESRHAFYMHHLALPQPREYVMLSLRQRKNDKLLKVVFNIFHFICVSLQLTILKLNTDLTKSQSTKGAAQALSRSELSDSQVSEPFEPLCNGWGRTKSLCL